MEGTRIKEIHLPESNVILKAQQTNNSSGAIRTLKNNSTTASGVLVVNSSDVCSSSPLTSGSIIKTANGETLVFTTAADHSHQSSSLTSQQQQHHHHQQHHQQSASTVTLVYNNSTQNDNSRNSLNHHGENKSSTTIVPETVSHSQLVAGSGGMSIVQFQLPNQAMVQSVIQPNHQSVIQQTNPISAIQMVKEEGSEPIEHAIYEDESKRRREILARRPSYRKILNDLSLTETADGSGSSSSNIEGKSSEDETDQPTTATSAISIPSYLKVLPTSIQLGSQDGTTTTIQGIPTIMTNPNTGSSTIVQYATSGHEGQFIVPADLQAYQLRPTNPSALSQNVVVASQNIPTHDEAIKKRELRLLKNREAAKECRRKKKEYIKCLENRVAVLENQNKALIDELKTLKELYCKKSE